MANIGLFGKLRAYGSVFRRARRPFDTLRLLRRRPALLLGVNAMEIGMMASGRVDTRLKMLAELKTAALVGCPFCVDIGSALSLAIGIREEQLRSLHDHGSSPVFDEVETLVLDLAVAMAARPMAITDDLQDRLRRHFDETQRVELVTAIAWENYRSRSNRALGVLPSGFSDGAFCVRPEG